MKEFGKFYRKDEVLHFESDVFSGSNPLISPPLLFPVLKERFGEDSSVQEVVVGEKSFIVKLTKCLCSGPLSGYRRIEVFQNNENILFYEWGSHGFGSNYEKGNVYTINGREALLLYPIIQMKDILQENEMIKNDEGFYLLWFSNFEIIESSSI